MTFSNASIHSLWTVSSKLQSSTPVKRFLESSWRHACPEFATTGFATSYTVVLASLPFILVTSLVLVWSIASIGPARKTLSTALILTFGVPVYPILTALVLAIFWTVVSFAAWAAAIAAPIFLVVLALDALCAVRPHQQQETVPACSIGEVICSVAMAISMCIASVCTTGACIFTLSLQQTTASDVIHVYVQFFLNVFTGHVHVDWDVAQVGFLTSYAATLVSLPLFLSVGLYKTWSVSGRKRQVKTLAASAMVAAVPLYPILTGLVLAITWTGLDFILSQLSIVGPIGLAVVGWANLWWYSFEFVAKERRSPAVTDDIGFGMLFVGFFMGLANLCTFGSLALLLTFVKAPILFMCSIYHFIAHTAQPLRETGWWCPIALLAWCFALIGGMCTLVLSIVLSALTKFVLAAIWPAYISTGWLRFFGGGGRRREAACCTPFVEGVKAGYQVLWASDLLTNAVIVGDFDLFKQTVNEFAEIATGQREQLSPECRTIACLPPVIVGLFLGSWDMTERVLANQLGVSVDVVQGAWASLRDQMIRIGKASLAAGLLDEDYVASIPPELVIGLPARVMLDTVDRSPEGELLLANGLCVTEGTRPTGGFFETVWQNLQQARSALHEASLTSEQRSSLCGALLAGGADVSSLPPGLACVVKEFEQLPESVRLKCETVHKHLIALAIECSRQRSFREQLESVIQSLRGEPDKNAAYNTVTGLRNTSAANDQLAPLL
eukprot:TRINITY_DN28481_c0_g1_i1.p1 TRINITY_DN28481_c0_g1~~TRINITY_DN28481_c0_g1_i1.p1  ORF type:complete len:726 (+),score=102.01 TRINITY_DN28481_c0_g1_i1:60-2237(+)